MSSPWLKFYPSDWRADPALRMCSIGARGLWMEMLCVMHEANPRGTLLINGRPLSSRQIASLAGGTIDEVDGYLCELEEAGVFSRTGDGTIFSRRMQRDAEKEVTDKANGGKGGNPALKREKQGVNPSANPEDKAQKPEARTHIPDQVQPNPEKTNSTTNVRSIGKPMRPNRDELQDRFWKAYPSRGEASNPKAPALEKFARAVKSGVDPEEIIAAAQRYSEIEHRAGRGGTEKVAQAVTWLNQRRWGDYPAAPPSEIQTSAGVFVERGSAEWDAWVASGTKSWSSYCKIHKAEGRYFPSKFPPAKNRDAA